jgi:lauroyl/myristoyl acyltransferase
MLLPVYLPRNGNTYEAHVLAEISYERGTLRDTAARQKLTQEIVTVFEPVIQKHIEQWYQFIPIWQKQSSQLLKHQVPTSKLQ